MKAKVEKQQTDDRFGGLTEQEVVEAQKLIDPEGELRAANISKKSHWREVKKVIETCEVIVYVVDARDPEGTRSDEVDQIMEQSGKKVVYVLNKSDLVPTENAKAWQQKYKA